MTIITKEQAYARAHALVAYLAAQGLPLGYRKALDAVAAQEGLRNWNTLAARLKENQHVKASRPAQATPAKPATPAAVQDDLWEADVVRFGYGCEEFHIDARSLKEALDVAYTRACNTVFSEHDSCWYLTAAMKNGESVFIPKALTCSGMKMETPEDETPGLRRFHLSVTREGVAHGEVSLTLPPDAADTQEDPLEQLLGLAFDLSCSESSSEYAFLLISAEPLEEVQ